MEVRTRAIFSFFVFAVAVVAAGCGYTQQQSKFQMSFLPPAPRSAPAEFSDPPVIPQPNLYLKDVPAFLLANPQVSARKTHADALAREADQRFQQGKKCYQAQDMPGARREFDAAVDLLLEASDTNPADRPVYAHLLDAMVESVSRFDRAGMGASAAVEEGKFEKSPFEDILEMTFPVDPRLKNRVRDQVSATVSQLPLSVNDTVLSYINYFNTRGRKTLIAATERSGRYRPMIQRILDEEGVPQELIHLAQAESGFIPRAVSRKAAGGMWQFLAWRGQEYGLMRTPYMDERMDPEKATRAAAHHLRDLYHQFGDWYLAIAAYNCGPGTVEKAVERTGFADFWELRNRGALPAETTNYVPIILALTIMEKNAAEYGIQGIQLDPAIEYDTVEVSSPTSLALVSDVTDTPLTELTALNPAILKSTAPAGCLLHVPKGAGNQLMTALQLIPAERRNAWRMHRVGPGETLADVGKRYGATPASIAAANSLQSAVAVEGDRLLIPAALRPEAPAKRISARKTPVRRASASRAKTPRTAGAKPASKAAPKASAAVLRTALR